MSETSTLQSHAQRDFLYALAQKCTDAESTDFTIVSNGKEFKIHKVILSLHSKYFDRLFKSEYKVWIYHSCNLLSSHTNTRIE